MARYMGAPRCRPVLGAKSRRRAFIPDEDSDDSEEQTRDEIPDSEDLGSSSQVSFPSVSIALSLADKLY